MPKKKSNSKRRPGKARTRKARPSKAITRGARMLDTHVKRYDNMSEAAKSLQATGGIPCSRANIWHWINCVHSPSRRASTAMFKWAKIPPMAWDQP